MIAKNRDISYNSFHDRPMMPQNSKLYFHNIPFLKSLESLRFQQNGYLETKHGKLDHKKIIYT